MPNYKNVTALTGTMSVSSVFPTLSTMHALSRPVVLTEHGNVYGERINYSLPSNGGVFSDALHHESIIILRHRVNSCVCIYYTAVQQYVCIYLCYTTWNKCYLTNIVYGVITSQLELRIFNPNLGAFRVLGIVLTDTENVRVHGTQRES